jgi:hypothetical protein
MKHYHLKINRCATGQCWAMGPYISMGVLAIDIGRGHAQIH